MRPWLQGDLTGVDPRAELPLLRDAVLGAAHRGEDLRPLFRALAEQDPVACAELAAGSRAVSHPVAVEGALVALEAMEEVLAPSGLYGRLADLAPEVGPKVLAEAARRHPAAEWLVRLDRVHDPVPGRIHLLVAAEIGRLVDAAAVCARGRLLDGLIAVSRELAVLEPAAALLRCDDRDGAAEAVAAALEARTTLPVVPVLAAVWGPDLDPVLARVAERLDAPLALEQLRRSATDFPRTAEAVASRLRGHRIG